MVNGKKCYFWPGFVWEPSQKWEQQIRTNSLFGAFFILFQAILQMKKYDLYSNFFISATTDQFKKILLKSFLAAKQFFGTICPIK